MKLITFEIENEIQIGALKEDRIVPFSQNSEIPKDMLGFLEDGEKALDRARDLFETSKTFIESRDVKILKPILRPPKIIACLLYTSPSPRDVEESRMPSSA